MEALERFAADLAEGPNLTDLHFDVKTGMQSEWNKKALQMKQTTFSKMLLEEYKQVPEWSIQYFEELIWDTFQWLAGIWKNVQPQTTAAGEVESCGTAHDE